MTNTDTAAPASDDLDITRIVAAVEKQKGQVASLKKLGAEKDKIIADQASQLADVHKQLDDVRSQGDLEKVKTKVKAVQDKLNQLTDELSTDDDDVADAVVANPTNAESGQVGSGGAANQPPADKPEPAPFVVAGVSEPSPRNDEFDPTNDQHVADARPPAEPTTAVVPQPGSLTFAEAIAYAKAHADPSDAMALSRIVQAEASGDISRLGGLIPGIRPDQSPVAARDALDGQNRIPTAPAGNTMINTASANDPNATKPFNPADIADAAQSQADALQKQADSMADKPPQTATGAPAVDAATAQQHADEAQKKADELRAKVDALPQSPVAADGSPAEVGKDVGGDNQGRVSEETQRREDAAAVDTQVRSDPTLAQPVADQRLDQTPSPTPLPDATPPADVAPAQSDANPTPDQQGKTTDAPVNPA